MGISKYNAEGYYDPTAYEGIRRAEEGMKKMRINYPTGYLELNIDHFFPCTIDKARKVFSLIHRYSSESDKERLVTFLKDLERRYLCQMKDCAEKASSYPEYSAKHRKHTLKFKESRRLCQRTRRNLEVFSSGRERK